MRKVVVCSWYVQFKNLEINSSSTNKKILPKKTKWKIKIIRICIYRNAKAQEKWKNILKKHSNNPIIYETSSEEDVNSKNVNDFIIDGISDYPEYLDSSAVI